jgi:hypothetical protein
MTWIQFRTFVVFVRKQKLGTNTDIWSLHNLLQIKKLMDIRLHEMSLQHRILIRSCKLVHKHVSIQSDCKTTPIHYSLEEMVLGYTFHNSFNIYWLNKKLNFLLSLLCISVHPSTCSIPFTCNKTALHNKGRKALGRQNFTIWRELKEGN